MERSGNKMVSPQAERTSCKVANRKIVVAFDVDGTLIRLGDDAPKYENIALLKQFSRLGCQIVVASDGGQEYAARWVLNLGLQNDVTAIIEKGKESFAAYGVDIHFDDTVTDLAEIDI